MIYLITGMEKKGVMRMSKRMSDNKRILAIRKAVPPATEE